MREIDWEAVRCEFPAVHGRAFLNTATYGQLPRKASDAARAHFERRDENACTDFLSWFDDLEPLRASIARLIHATADDIAFVTNASAALGLVLSGIDWRAGDEILTLEHEFPNQLYGAQCVQEVRGVECRWSELEQHVSPHTRLVLLSTVDYVTGLRPNLRPTIARLKEQNVLVYIDGTQSVGALEFDCRAIQPDFLVVDAYKWMISPNGAGFLYVSPEARKWLRPNMVGWRSDREWKNVDSLHHGAPRFSDRAEKYEGGMLAFPCLYAMRASAQLIEELGITVIEARVLELASLLRQELHRLGAESESPAGDFLRSQIVGARFENRDSSRLARELARQNIVVAARRGFLRASPHFYNNESDISALIQGLGAAIGQRD